MTIPLEQEQWLGEKAYLLMASKKMTPGILILLVSLVVLVLKNAIASLVYAAFTAGGHSGAAVAASVGNSVAMTASGLLIIALLAIIGGIIIARLEYRNYTYTFEEFNLRMKRGILHRTENSIPYRQVQDVDIDRTLTLQLMGLSKLTIITAGHEEAAEHEKAEVVIEPIQKDVAEEIRHMLERKIGVQVVRTVEQADSEMSEETDKTAPQKTPESAVNASPVQPPNIQP